MSNQSIPSAITERLYPLKFKPILKSAIWGGSDICKFKDITPVREGIGESWEISCVTGNVSVVSNGLLTGMGLDRVLSQAGERLVGKEIYQKFGNTFPLLIKFIDARKELSIQVHPNDALAKERHNSFGKTEMWYIIHAEKEAFLYSGFKTRITPEEYVQRVKENRFTETLMRHSVTAGDLFFLPAGRVHAIGAGCFVAEIQQTSDITYRIYDYNRKDANGKPRELHTELAKDAIDFKVYDSYRTAYKRETNHPVPLITSPYFVTRLLELDVPQSLHYEETDSFVIYICIKGHCTLKDDRGNTEFIHQGETLLIPAETSCVAIIPGESSLLLETSIPHQSS